MIHSSARDSITVQTEQVLIEKYDRLYRLAYSYVYNEDDAWILFRKAPAKRYASGGYDVIVDGIVGPWFLEPWRAIVREGYEVHYIVLRASKEETMQRAVDRSKLDRKTNVALVETMWEQFCRLGIYESNVIETTSQSVQETVCAVKEKIASGTALLSD